MEEGAVVPVLHHPHSILAEGRVSMMQNLESWVLVEPRSEPMENFEILTSSNGHMRQRVK